MRARMTVPPALTRLADLQAGVVTREQALALGLPDPVRRRLLREGRWQPVASGVYRTDSVPADWPALAWAGVLLGGDRARLGPRASGHLHGLLPEELPIDVLVPTGRTRGPAGPWQFRRERPTARSARSVGSPPSLAIEECVLDLCDAAGEGEVVSLVTTAVQTRRTRADRLATALRERPRHQHRRLLQSLLGDVAAGAESPLEVAYLRDVERAHGLPQGQRQQSRRGLPYCSDVGYDEVGLLVELDGRVGHLGTGAFRDLQRDNLFALTGLLTLRYGWFDVVEHPCRVAAQVARVLQGRGWLGVPTSCSRCVRVGPDALVR